MAAALEPAFEVIDYADPLAALLHMGQQPPDAAVLAAKLGEVSGVQIIAALKRDDATRHVRAVLVAGDEQDRQAALEAGASAYVRASDCNGLRDTLSALMGLRH